MECQRTFAGSTGTNGKMAPTASGLAFDARLRESSTLGCGESSTGLTNSNPAVARAVTRPGAALKLARELTTEIRLLRAENDELRQRVRELEVDREILCGVIDRRPSV